MCFDNMWKYLCYAVGIIFGSIMLFGGAFFLHSLPSLFSKKIEAQLPIVRGSDAYNRYTTPSVPLSAKMYMFNVTNPEEVRDKGAKPQLVQVGPFSLTERRRREILGFSADNTTLDYKLYRTFFFNQNESLPLDTVITMPNAPAFSALFKAKDKAYNTEDDTPVNVISDYLTNETLYITHTADEWLFKGVGLNFLDAMEADGVPIDDPIPGNKFGFYYLKNGTWDQQADGIMTISTGVDGDMSNIGKVVKWNKKSEISFWRGKHCNAIKGTDGQFFHPSVQKDEILDIFAPDLCRTLSIEFVKTTSIRSIELYRFGISQSFFKPIDHDETTSCYCVKRADDKKFCKLSGVTDVSSCRKKPIVLSTPHFYNGDPLLRQAVDGLQPSAANHDTFIDIEPMTGAVLRVRRRLQVNVEMQPSEKWAPSMAFKSSVIHPFVWMDQSIVVTDELAQKLENKLTKVVRILRILCYAALITGPIILVATLIFICRDIRSEEKKMRGMRNRASGSSSAAFLDKNKKKKQQEMTNMKASNDSSGDYKKVQVIVKPSNATSNVDGDSAQ